MRGLDIVLEGPSPALPTPPNSRHMYNDVCVQACEIIL